MNEIADTKTKEKWVRDIECYQENSFINVLNATGCSRARIFHYKLINRILSTNTFLKLINVQDNENCTFCKSQPETLAHLYWYCPKTQIYISCIKSSLRREHNIYLEINKAQWFFPTEGSEMETSIIVQAKMVIYEARLKETLPNLSHLNNKLNLKSEQSTA